MDTARRRADGDGRVSPRTRYEWRVTAVRAGETVIDVRGICKHYTTAVHNVETELAGAPGDADAYGSVRGLTVSFGSANAANGACARHDSQAIAVRGADGVSWFRDRNADGNSASDADGDSGGDRPGSVGA